MKKKLLSLIAFALALVMAMSALPVGAAVHFEGKETLRADDAASVENDIFEEPDNAESFAEQPKFIPPAPPGYNSNDFTKIVTFLEQTDKNGVKNGKKLDSAYTPMDMETWGEFYWEPVNGVFRIVEIYISDYDLCGDLDLSGCSALEHLECYSNEMLSSINLSNCSALKELYCYSNEMLSNINLNNCSALTYLDAEDCIRLKEIDVSSSPLLNKLYCSDVLSLDVSNNDAIDGTSHNLVYDEIRCKNNVVVGIEGSGYLVFYGSNGIEAERSYYSEIISGYISGYYSAFYGWYNKNTGELLSTSLGIDVSQYSNIEITARFELVHFRYKSSITGETEEYRIYYEDSFFEENSFEYNHDLTKASIRLAMAAASTESDNIEFMLRGLGFRDGLSLNYPEPTEDTIGYAIGSKNATVNGQDVSIIAVAVRGGGYGQEWGDNGRLGSGKEHEGFSRAANTVYNAVKGFVQENASSLNPKIKVWIAGFSRAGAVANIAAHRLSTDGIGRENFNASDVYAFCFECPNTNMNSVVNVPRSNIRNFVNPIDVVPMVPLTDWGYGRYGKTLYFPYKGVSGYSSAKAEMKSRYADIIGWFIDHEKVWGGYDVCPYNVADYTKEGSNQRASFVEFFRRASRIVSKQDYLNNQSSIIWLLKNTLGGSKSERALIPSINAAQLFRNILLACGVIGDGVSAASFYENASEYLLISHYPELCLAWIDSMDPYDDSDYSKLRYTRLGVDYYWNNGSKSGENPASIDIYRGNTKVASFKDGQFVLSDESISAYIDYDGQIVFILPDYSTYRAEIGSTSTAQLSVTMSKCLGESAAVEQVVAYVDLPVNAGDTVGGNINYLDYEDPYSLSFNNTAVEPDVQQGELYGNALTHNVAVKVEGDGVVYGGGLYAPGEYALLRVASGEETFEGWYLNGELVSTELEHRFMVTEDIAYTASFGAAQEPTPTPTPEPTPAPDPDAPQIVVSSVTTLAGNTVTVDVSLLNNPGIVSMALTVDFDERLTLASVTDSGLIPGQVHSPTMGNPYVLCWVNDTATENYTANGVIATLTFEVPEDMPVGEYPITISYDLDNYDIYNCDVETVEFAVVNGGVRVIDVLIGDVNTDTKVNALDRLYLTRYLANWANYPASVINMIAADVNTDTKVNALDRLILTRHLANWAGYETLPYSTKSAPTAKYAEVKGDEPTIIVDSVTANPGETVTVCVSLENNPGIVSMALTLSFDEALEFIGRTDTGLLPGQVHSPTLGNPYTLCWVNDTATTNYTVNGTIVELTFKLSEDAEPGTYPITITYDLDNYDIYNCDVELVEFAVVNGGVTYEPDEPEEPAVYTVTFIDSITGEIIAEVEVEEGEAAEAPEAPAHDWYTFTGWDVDFSEVTEDLTVTAQYTELGDVNGDGSVDMSDALAYMRWLICADTVETEDEIDFNGDGETNLFDALLLMRHVLGTI